VFELTETQKAMDKYVELMELIPEDGTALKDMLGNAIMDFGNIRYDAGFEAGADAYQMGTN
jgi:hypothetical protein